MCGIRIPTAKRFNHKSIGTRITIYLNSNALKPALYTMTCVFRTGFIGTGALLLFIVFIIRGNFGKLNIYTKRAQTKRLSLHSPNSD